MNPKDLNKDGSEFHETQYLEPDGSNELMATRFVENISHQGLQDSEPKITTGNLLLNRFQVLKLLGTGTFGKVYLAKDEQLGRLVAVKVAKNPSQNKKQFETFLSEARMLAKLDHPNIVPVYDVINSQSEGVFIISKYLDGGNLSKVIANGPHSFPDIAKWIAIIAEALHHAHVRGLVHRDIKPDNILLDSKGNLFIADFGLALTDELFDLTTGLLGTPAYMSPEQASGQAHMVDGRTDIFSLGVILYEFLAGRRPFEAKTVSLTLQQIIRVAARPPRQINDSIPKELERICLKALNKNLDDRYLTGLDFAEDLKNYLRQVDVGASTKVAGDSVFSNFPSSSSTSSSTTGSGLNKSRNVDAPGMESVSKVLESGGATLQSALANSDKEFSRTRPLLEQQLYDIKDGDAAKTKVLLALLPADPSYAKLLVDPLLAANPQDFMVIRQRLAPYAEVVIPLLEQKFARLPELDNSVNLRIAGALALWQTSSPLFEKILPGIINRLVAQDLIYLGEWVEIFKPIQKLLLHKLVSFGQDVANPVMQRNYANAIALEYASDNERILFHLFLSAPRGGEKVIFNKILPIRDKMIPYLKRFRAAVVATNNPQEKAIAETRKGMAAALQLVLEDTEGFSIFLNAVDETPRTTAQSLVCELGARPAIFYEKIRDETNAGAKASMILTLGGMNFSEVPESQKKQWLDHLLELYQNHPDSGVHGALDWILRQKLGLGHLCDKSTRDIRLGSESPRNWHVNNLGQCLISIKGPVRFLMGSPLDEVGRHENEKLHEVVIPRSFAVAQKVVTMEQYLKFNPTFQGARASKGADNPVNGVSWYQAAEFCNWLNEQENIPKSEWCYLPNDKGLYAAGMRVANDFLRKKGYRLPTEAEWEYCSRAGTKTPWFFGTDASHLDQFGCYQNNSKNRVSPVGHFKPNDLGFFDMAGNVYQWVQDLLQPYPDATLVEDIKADVRVLDDMSSRVLRGGAFYYPGDVLRSAHRGGLKPEQSSDGSGFRVARTLA